MGQRHFALQDVAAGSGWPPCERIEAFQRVALKAGETRQIEFKLTTDDLAFTVEI